MSEQVNENLRGVVVLIEIPSFFFTSGKLFYSFYSFCCYTHLIRSKLTTKKYIIEYNYVLTDLSDCLFYFLFMCIVF